MVAKLLRLSIYCCKYYIEKHVICHKDYRLQPFVSIQYVHGDFLGIDSSTDLDDRYLNLFQNAYINRHAHTEYLKMTEVYSPLGILYMKSPKNRIYCLYCFYLHFIINT